MLNYIEIIEIEDKWTEIEVSVANLLNSVGEN